MFNTIETRIFDSILVRPFIVVDTNGRACAEFDSCNREDAGSGSNIKKSHSWCYILFHQSQHKAGCLMIACAERHLRIDDQHHLAGLSFVVVPRRRDHDFLRNVNGLDRCFPFCIPIPFLNRVHRNRWSNRGTRSLHRIDDPLNFIQQVVIPSLPAHIATKCGSLFPETFKPKLRENTDELFSELFVRSDFYFTIRFRHCLQGI